LSSDPQSEDGRNAGAATTSSEASVAGARHAQTRPSGMAESSVSRDCLISITLEEGANSRSFEIVPAVEPTYKMNLYHIEPGDGRKRFLLDDRLSYPQGRAALVDLASRAADFLDRKDLEGRPAARPYTLTLSVFAPSCRTVTYSGTVALTDLVRQSPDLDGLFDWLYSVTPKMYKLPLAEYGPGAQVRKPSHPRNVEQGQDVTGR